MFIRQQKVRQIVEGKQRKAAEREQTESRRHFGANFSSIFCLPSGQKCSNKCHMPHAAASCRHCQLATDNCNMQSNRLRQQLPLGK